MMYKDIPSQYLLRPIARAVKNQRVSLIAGCVVASLVQPAVAFEATFELSSLLSINGGDGSKGVVINGSESSGETGFSVSGAGDVNGDGISDIIISAPFNDSNGVQDAGESFIVFGSSNGFVAQLELSALNGNNGFSLKGIDKGDQSGLSIQTAGDINNDGIDDVIIGAFRADPNGLDHAGESYVVFGSTNGFASSLELSNLNGSNGFVLIGDEANDVSGISVSTAGDINGDGIDDIVIGAGGIDYGEANVGGGYVVFGSSSDFVANLELSSLNGDNGFVISGVGFYDSVGDSVSTAGDVNGDGINDIIISGASADPNDIQNAGESYIVFGSSSGFASSLELSSLDGNNGFVINGIDVNDGSGGSASGAGDVNGDGIDDVIIGATLTDPNGTYSGQSYVVFGNTAFNASLELSSLNGSNGFTINGINQLDYSGYSVSSAGDINGDGFDDVIIGAGRAGLYSATGAGESYVVFGKPSFTPSLELSTLDGRNGFMINGAGSGDSSGNSVRSVGDVSGDGIDDVVIGSRFGGNDYQGQAHIVFGEREASVPPNDFNADGTSDILLRNTSGASEIRSVSNNIVTSTNDLGSLNASYTIQGTGDFNSDGTSDILWRRDDGLTLIQSITNNAQTSFTSIGFLPVGSTIEGTGDFNADGTSDVLWRRADGLTVIWSISNNIVTAFTSLGYLPAGSTVGGTGDYNTDGTSDILWRRADGLTVIWPISNNTRVSFASLGYMPLSFTIEGTGNFNADSTSDILWRRDDGLTVIWSIDNNIRTSFTSIGFLPVTSAIEGTGDYNADGTSDILWRRTDGLAVIWSIGNNSVSSFTSLGFLPLTLEIQ